MSNASNEQAISRTLAGELGSRTAWDEPPCLYTIHLRAGRCRLQPVPVPLAAWAARRPPEVLAAIANIAEATSQLPGACHLIDLYGTAFRFEGWGLDMRNLSAAEQQQAEADTAAHQIHTRPDRIEYRMILAADRTGTTYSARQQRGDDQVPTDIFTPGHGQLRHDGQVPAALTQLTAALTGTPLPQSADLRDRLVMNGRSYRMTSTMRTVLAAVVDAAEPVWGLLICEITGLGTSVVYPALRKLINTGVICDEWESPAPNDRAPRRFYRPAFDRRWYRANRLLPQAAAPAGT